jgi:hypothetical protein
MVCGFDCRRRQADDQKPEALTLTTQNRSLNTGSPEPANGYTRILLKALKMRLQMEK